jgi:nucleosome binding factor SPN SPT16 subunit
MKQPEDYTGPTVEFVLKDGKQENLSGLLDDMLKTNVTSGNKIAIFMKNEEEDGDLSKTLIDRIKANNFEMQEMQTFMNKVNCVKIAPELENLKTAASFTEWSMRKIIKELEDCIERDIKMKHNKLAGNVERLLDNPDKLAPFMAKFGVSDSQLLEFPLPVLVQSGDNITMNKFTSECENSEIMEEAVYLNVCGKFTDMQAMASRTLLFNPSDVQKNAYQLAFDAQAHLASKLVPGTKICDAHKSTVDFIRERNSNYANKIHVNFGFGIGCKYKEDELSINSNNQTVVVKNMVFHIRVTFKEVDKKACKGCIAIGDTYIVEEEGLKLATGAIPRKYAQISYTLDEESDGGNSKEN